MSLPSSPRLASSLNQPAPATQKPGSNVYTVMLILAFIFIVTASVMLAMELQRFGPGVPWVTPGAGGS